MFTHAFDFAFEVASRCEDASDVTPEMLRTALIRRLSRLLADELVEACGLFDTTYSPAST